MRIKRFSACSVWLSIIAIFCSTNLKAMDIEIKDREYYEQWAAIPYAWPLNVKQKIEICKARQIVFADTYPEAVKNAVKAKLTQNEKLTSGPVPALKMAVAAAPISAQTVALLLARSKLSRERQQALVQKQQQEAKKK